MKKLLAPALAHVLAFALLFTSLHAIAAVGMSLTGVMEFVVYLVIVGLIFWCIWWFVSFVGVPEPFNKVIRVVLGLLALIIVVNLLLGLVGTPFINFR